MSAHKRKRKSSSQTFFDGVKLIFEFGVSGNFGHFILLEVLISEYFQVVWKSAYQDRLVFLEVLDPTVETFDCRDRGSICLARSWSSVLVRWGDRDLRSIVFNGRHCCM